MTDDPQLFDSAAFARRLRALLAATGLGVRQAAAQAGVSPSAMSRAASGWPQLSHENVLRLEAWMQAAAADQPSQGEAA